MKLNIYGKQTLEIIRRDGRWQAFILGGEGKKRDAGIGIPDDLNEDEVVIFIADLFHEWVTGLNDSIIRLDD